MSLIPGVSGDALFSGGLSLLNNILGFGSQASQNEFNAREAQKQRDWASHENALNADRVMLENRRSQEWQDKQSGIARDWEELMYNTYNSPSAMMRQYKEAGLNPFLGASGNIGSGMGTNAPMSGSPAQSSPSSSIPGTAASASGVFRPSLSQDFAQVVGIDSQVANQRAHTIDTKWKTYAYIYEHAGRDAANEFKDNNPDMLGHSDPEHSMWMDSWIRRKTKENLENDILEVESWLKSRWGDLSYQKNLQKVDAEIDKLFSDKSLNESQIKVNASSIKRNLADVFKLKAEGNHYIADTATINHTRQWIVGKLIHQMNLLDRQDARDAYLFDSQRDMYKWITSPEGKKAIMQAARMKGIRNADALYTAVMDIFNGIGISASGSAGSAGSSTYWYNP